MSRATRMLNPPTPAWAKAYMAQSNPTVPEWRPVPRNVQAWYMRQGERLACTRTMPDGSWEVNIIDIGAVKARTMAAMDALPKWRRELIHEHGNAGRTMCRPQKAPSPKVSLADLGL